MNLSMPINRLFTGIIGATAVVMCTLAVQAEDSMQPEVRRIKMATIAAPELKKVEAWYGQWLDYSVVERGSVTEELAASWAAPESAGRPFIVMQPASGADVLIRAVEIDAVPDYRAMTTFGWNAIELVVDDLYTLHDRLKQSPFEIIGEPRSLGGSFASIHAMQMIGPAQEMLYLTTETGDRDASSLPIPQSAVDRLFIVVLAGPDLDRLRDFYTGRLNMAKGPIFDIPIRSIARAQGLPDNHLFSISLARGTEHGNSIELDGYPETATHRPRPDGQLPPGVALVSFSVDNLDALDIDFITNPVRAYGTMRAASFIGPAGELTELIEDPR